MTIAYHSYTVKTDEHDYTLFSHNPLISSISAIFETLLLSVVCEVIKHMMYKIDIANIYLGILLHYLLVLAAVLIFGYAFNWVNQLPVYVLAGMCGVVLILCCYLDISRVKADIDEINGLCEKRV